MGSMRKKIFTLLTIPLLAIPQARAYDGVIIVLEAPLLKLPSLSSTVLQTIRKGETVYIPREIGNLSVMPEFIPTFDRAGNRAYIPSRYVKVVTGTVKENLQPIHYAGHDPTDYRIEEPIPVTYPFENRNFLRASAAFIVANNTTSTYAYNSAFNDQKFRAEMGGRLTLTKKVAFDNYDRFYFGFIGLITSAKNTTKFKNDNLAEESRGIIRGGPWLTYDAFKNDDYRLTIGTGFTFNYHRTTLFVDSGKEAEERIFSGFSISPMTSTTLQINNILPYTDFVTGVDLSLFLPHTLKTTNEAELPVLWGEDNQISTGLKAQASIFMGVQVKY
jgi:hypothetical protein